MIVFPAVTPLDLERANFYANTCTKQFEKAQATINGITLEEWELFEFTYHYCKEVLGDRSRTFFLTIRCRRDSMLPDIPKLNDEQWREIGFQYNPITFQGGRWYYWDETWSLSSRPFSSYEEALIDLGKYLGHLDRRSTRVE